MSQPDTDPGGWTIDLYAKLDAPDSPVLFVKRFTLTAASDASIIDVNRVVAVATMPSASGWEAIVTPPPGNAAQKPILVSLVASETTAFGVMSVLP